MIRLNVPYEGLNSCVNLSGFAKLLPRIFRSPVSYHSLQFLLIIVMLFFLLLFF